MLKFLCKYTKYFGLMPAQSCNLIKRRIFAKIKCKYYDKQATCRKGIGIQTQRI